ncbi:MAG: ABC transporter substrate-binding protein [Ectothiorhodospiraceae bacterium AqS1]|nr:ABC transporter substrate-binding protein [Ectothiorhodospiraceae bacterium AqS1]
MKKSFLIAGAAALATGISSAVAADIKVGSAGGITGPIPDLVAPMMAARDLAAQHINEQGGLLDGHDYVLVKSDSKCDAKGAVDAGQKLVNVEQVVAIVGPNCSGATIGMAESVTIPSGVVILSESATAPSITDLDDKGLVFRNAPSDAYQGAALASMVMESGYNKVAVAYANDDYNKGIAEVFMDAFKAGGGTIAASAEHEPEKASYTSEISTLASSGAEALMVFAYYGSSGTTIVRNSLENGLFDMFFGADGMRNEQIISDIGADNLRGKIMVSAPSSDTESSSYKMFAKEFSDAGQDPSAVYTPGSYDAAFLMALAIEKAGGTDRDGIAAALMEVANAPGEMIMPGEWSKAKAAIQAGRDINYQGASGDIEFDAKGDVAGIYSLSVIDNMGQWVEK